MLKTLPVFLRGFTTFSKANFSAVAGNLYTWGSHSEGTGFSDLSNNPEIRNPRKLKEFNNNVVHVSMGTYHAAVITADGDLYTFGAGSQGQLGHNDGQTSSSPRLVEYFAKNNKKIEDVCCKGNHTVVLTKDGELYTFGKLRLNDYQRFIPTWALGDQKKFWSPVKIGELEGKKIISVSSGDHFISVVAENNEVFQWGRGDMGNLGDGRYQTYVQPTLNKYLKTVAEKSHAKPIKIRSNGYSSVVLLDNGKLLGTGDNREGQLGVRMNIGITLDEVVNSFTPVVEEHLNGKKVKDFSLGGASLVVLTEDNKTYFSGLGLCYKPLEWPLPTNSKVVRVVAAHDTFAALTEENAIYAFNENFIPNAEFNLREKVWVSKSNLFGNGKILDIGGGSTIHWALVKN